MLGDVQLCLELCTMHGLHRLADEQCWIQVVDAGAVVLLVLCVQEPETGLKRVAASALSDIAKHTPELAQAVVDAGMLC